MTAHNHMPRCCCGPAKADPCPACAQHSDVPAGDGLLVVPVTEDKAQILCSRTTCDLYGAMVGSAHLHSDEGDPRGWHNAIDPNQGGGR